MKCWPEKIPYSLPNTISVNITQEECLSLGKSPTIAECERLFSHELSSSKVLLTPSCTSALEMCALWLDLSPGDEVILPSFTFVTSASAFALRGAKLVFVDIRPDTLNIDEKLVEAAITPNTKAIIAVHYAGVSCDLEALKSLSSTYNIALIEDAAQCIGAYYQGQALGSIGDLGCFSFHHTKNIHAGGEGGALSINNQSSVSTLEVIQEKGTNRSQFLRGEVDKYTWQRLSSSYVMSEVQGLCLLPQLQNIKTITEERLVKWNNYFDALLPLSAEGICSLPYVPDGCLHNGHIFYLLLADKNKRDHLLKRLREANVEATTHFVPLHSSPAGKQHSIFIGEDRYTTDCSNRLLRLPLHSHLTQLQQLYIIEVIKNALC